MNVKNGSGPPNVAIEHSLMSALHACMNGSGPPNVEHSHCMNGPMLNTASCLHCRGCSNPQNLLTQADLMPPPDGGLNSYNSPQSSVEVGVTSIEAYGHGYVAIDVQQLVNLLEARGIQCNK
jgi:hypothetical protein